MIRTILGVILLYLLFLLATIPASVLPVVFDKTIPGRIELVGLSGSVWRGRVERVAFDGLPLANKMEWSLSVLRLLTGRVGIELTMSEGKANVVANRNQIQLRDTRLTVPLAVLGKFVKPVQQYQLNGQGVLAAQHFEWDSGKAQGDLTVEWHQASSNMVSLPVLGDYQLVANAGPRGFAGKVTTLSGALQVNGDGTWSQKEGLSIRLQLRPEPSQAEVLRPLLSIAGQPAADGTYHLNTSMK
ncbi:type II secretion system protein N [Chitinivorax sp. B]|uniref:type II secretion system protein N n=1 Tax=Chitinivorax sp. B TaxID=2502235 RepID=UPI0010F9C041|nr:type II secretion system protein N [Chitinivorax sp. B]